jgi:hypothetical protein
MAEAGQKDCVTNGREQSPALQKNLLSIEREKHQHGGVFPQVLGPKRALHTSLGKIPH